MEAEELSSGWLVKEGKFGLGLEEGWKWFLKVFDILRVAMDRLGCGEHGKVVFRAIS
jgi:hypothetical protein